MRKFWIEERLAALAVLGALACSSESETKLVASGGGAAGLGGAGGSSTGGAATGGSGASPSGGAAGSAVGGSGGDAAVDAPPSCAVPSDAGVIGKWPDSKTKWCNGTGCSGAGQDGDYEVNPPTYLVLGNTVKDTITGLEWRKDVIGNTPWNQASSACAKLDADGGTGTWRLPTRLELTSLLDFGSSDTLLQPAELDKPSGANSNSFWTLTEVAGNPALAWTVSFLVGSVGSGAKTSSLSIRCVRGAAPVSKLEANPSCGVVSDLGLGLMWVRPHDSASYSWAEAVFHCEGLKHAGFEDWRLPNAKELLTIVKDSASQPAIEQGVFGSSPGAPFWSSTPRRADPKTSLTLDFAAGVESFDDALTPHFARCVRSLP